MSALDLWRSELRALIPRGFLRRDQGEGLFLSDFPRRGVYAFPALKAAGFDAVEIRGLARIDGSLDKYRELEAALPAFTPAPRDDTLYLFSLARRLTRFGGDITAENLPLMRILPSLTITSVFRTVSLTFTTHSFIIYHNCLKYKHFTTLEKGICEDQP